MSTLLTIDEAAQRLTVAPSTLNNWRSHRTGPAWTKVGGLVRYMESDIEKYLTARKMEPQRIDVTPPQTIPIPARRRKESQLSDRRFGGHRTRRNTAQG